MENTVIKDVVLDKKFDGYGTHWTGKRNRGQNIPNEMKTIWYRDLG